MRARALIPGAVLDLLGVLDERRTATHASLVEAQAEL